MTSWMGISRASGSAEITSPCGSPTAASTSTAPWSVGSGAGRTSARLHQQPSTQWFFNLTQRGDPIVVTGSSRELESTTAGAWQADWKDWVNGSALKRSVKTSPPEDASTVSAENGGRAGP